MDLEGVLTLEQKELTARLVKIHNQLANVYVKGDSAILLGGALQELRALVQKIEEGNSPAE